MTPSLPIVLAAFALPPATLPTEFRPLAPETLIRMWDKPGYARRERAVVLVHGMKLFPFRPHKATLAEMHEFQQPDADLPRALAGTFDVYGFAYAQTLPVDAYCHAPGLRNAIARLKALGYREIVLIGHSCGGVIVRQFVESYPDAGVTKVIQVAAPNLGSDLAVLKTGYHKVQSAIVESCVPAVRQQMVEQSRRLIPPRVEFACVVCKIPGFDGDVLVWTDSAWPEDLQRQGIPAALVSINHFDAMKGAASVRLIVELAKERLVRWSPEQVEQARRVLFRLEDNDAPRGKAEPPRSK